MDTAGIYMMAVNPESFIMSHQPERAGGESRLKTRKLLTCERLVRPLCGCLEMDERTQQRAAGGGSTVTLPSLIHTPRQEDTGEKMNDTGAGGGQTNCPASPQPADAADNGLMVWLPCQSLAELRLATKNRRRGQSVLYQLPVTFT